MTNYSNSLDSFASGVLFVDAFPVTFSPAQHKPPTTNQHKDKDKMPNMFASHLASFGESLKDAAENVIDKIDDKIDMPIIIGELRSYAL